MAAKGCKGSEVKTLRIVMLGKTGAGKSSLGNALMNRIWFEVGRGVNSKTTKCKWAYCKRRDLSIEVTDTPGLRDTYMEESDIHREVGKSVAFASPGPHIILMVLRCDHRFTKEELEVYETLKALFGTDICKHMIVIFNCMGQPGDEPNLEKQRQMLANEMRKPPKFLSVVLGEASNRYFGVSQILSDGDKERQMDDLVSMMLNLVAENQDEYYSGELCRNVDAVREGWIHRYMQTHQCSEEEATRAFKKAVLGEEPGLMTELANAVKAFLEKIYKVIQRSVEAVREMCSVM